MSEQDSFINEVTEEVRRDKLYRTFRRYGWIGVAAIVVLVGGAIGNEWLKSRAETEARAAGDAILAALEISDAGARSEALAALSVDENADRRAVVLMLQADAASAAGDVEGAVAAYDAIADDTATPAAWRDLATLKSAILGANTVSPDDRIARLNALSLAGGAFRLLASEQVALAEIEKGDTDAAISRLRDILADAETTQDLRRRASQLIVALGGSLTAE